MEAKELRIGNWVLVYEDGPMIPRKVEQICKNSDGFKGYYIVCREGSSKTLIEDDNDDAYIQPIALSHEILKQCGLKKHKAGISGADMWQGMDGYSVGSDSSWLFRGCSGVAKGTIELTLVGYFNSRIQYLHQLMNIYFALTGKELEIDLKLQP
jgi:hypothetical protein